MIVYFTKYKNYLPILSISETENYWITENSFIRTATFNNCITEGRLLPSVVTKVIFRRFNNIYSLDFNTPNYKRWTTIEQV